jgi:hypothetical protein
MRAHYTITNKTGNVTLIHPYRTAIEVVTDAERHESPLIIMTATDEDGSQETQSFRCLTTSPEDNRIIRRSPSELAVEVHDWCFLRGIQKDPDPCDD